MVPSPKVATYDLQPEMSAPELTDKAVAAIDSGKYDLIVLNYANPDMVGHTGSLSAAIKAVEAVNTGLGRIAEAIRRQDGALLVTADHGNCETMKDPETGGPHTSHTTNPVPVLLLGGQVAGIQEGRLADIAPTLLALMGLRHPREMTGHPLLGPMRRARNSLPTPITLALIAPALDHTCGGRGAFRLRRPGKPPHDRKYATPNGPAPPKPPSQQQAAARAARAASDEQHLAAERIAAAARLRKTEAATADVAILMDTLAARRRDAQARLDARPKRCSRCCR